MRKQFFLFILAQIFLITLFLMLGYSTFIINVEIAMIASALIVLSSMRSYKSLINRSVNADVSHYRDAVDKIDDPFDLYDEEENADDENALKLRKIKPQHWKNAIKTKSGFLSAGRLVGYIVLLGSLFSLKNHGMFHIPGYLLGLAVGIGVAVWIGRSKSV